MKGAGPLTPVQRAFEGGLIVAILAVTLATWFVGNVYRPLTAPPGPPGVPELQGGARYGQPTTQARFEALRASGGGTALVAAGIGLVGLGVAYAGVSLALAVRRGGPALRAAWRERTRDYAADAPTIIQAFVAFAAMTFAAGATLPFGPRGVLHVEAGAPVTVPLGGLQLGGPPGPTGGVLAIPGVADKRAVLGPGGRLTIVKGDALVRVDGELPTREVVELRDGAVLEVGALRATWRAAPAGDAARYLLLCGVVQAGALLLVIWPLLGWSAHQRVGLVTTGWLVEVRRGALGWLATLPLYLAVVFLWARLGDALGIPPANHPSIGLLERGGAPVALAILVQAALLAPLAEELLFRGLVLPAFARGLGPAVAVACSALLFGAIHPGFGSLAPIGLLGALFAGLAVTSPSRSLLGSFVAHGLHNGTTLCAVLAVQAATGA